MSCEVLASSESTHVTSFTRACFTESPTIQPCTTHTYTAKDSAASKQHGRRFLSRVLFGSALLLASQSVFASENKVYGSEEEVKTQTATGVGVGAVVGTLAAGPFGFIAGSVIGGFIGEGQGYKATAENSTSKDRIIQYQESEISQLQHQLDNSQQALATAQQASSVTQATSSVTQVSKVQPITSNMQGLNRDFSLSLSLQFRFGQSVIEPMYRNQLAQLAEFMGQHPQVIATITGFTDAVGANKPNLALSQRRAEAVQTLLRQLNVNTKQLHVTGQGENAPIYSTDSPQTRFFERRVLIELTVQ